MLQIRLVGVQRLIEHPVLGAVIDDVVELRVKAQHFFYISLHGVEFHELDILSQLVDAFLVHALDGPFYGFHLKLCPKIEEIGDIPAA